MNICPLNSNLSIILHLTNTFDNYFRLMAIFEAGIITKMNENEYEKLGKQKELSSQAAESVSAEVKKDTIRQGKGKETNEKLRPISLKMLQGAFYVLSLGNIFSGKGSF